MAQYPDRSVDARSPLHDHLYSSRRLQGFLPVSSTFCVCGLVSCNFEDDERTRRRVYLFPRRHSRILWHPPYVGQADAVSSSHSLCRSWRSVLFIRPQLALILRCVLSADSHHVGKNKIALLQADEKSRFAAPGACRRMGEKLECQLATGRQWRPFYPLPLVIRIPYRHLQSSCHHLGKRPGAFPIHRYEKRCEQNHESFGIRIHPKVSPARVAHRVYENQVLRFHAPINENTGKTGRSVAGSPVRCPSGKEETRIRYPVL